VCVHTGAGVVNDAGGACMLALESLLLPVVVVVTACVCAGAGVIDAGRGRGHV